MQRYIVKAIGTLPVRDVSQDDIAELLQHASATSTKGSLSKDTLRIIRGTCSRLFKAAIRAKLIDSNPAADLDLKLGTLTQDDRQRSIRPMTFAQLARFHRTAKHHASRRDAVFFLTSRIPGCAPAKHWRCSGPTSIRLLGLSAWSEPSP